MKKYEKKKKTHLGSGLALFGPVLLVAAFHLFSSRVLCRLEPKYAINK